MQKLVPLDEKWKYETEQIRNCYNTLVNHEWEQPDDDDLFSMISKFVEMPKKIGVETN